MATFLEKLKLVGVFILLTIFASGFFYVACFMKEPQPIDKNALTTLKAWGKHSFYGNYRGVAVSTDKDTVLNGEVEIVAIRIDGWSYSEQDFTVAFAATGKIKPGDKVECLLDDIAGLVRDGIPMQSNSRLICKKAN